MDDLTIAAAPRIGRGRFAELLEDAASPASREGAAMWNALVDGGVDPAVALGFFRMESHFGTKGITATHNTRSLGNVRSVADTANGGLAVATEQGSYIRYRTWAAGAADWAARMTGPLYAGAGLMTVRQVLPKYAPTADNNNPDAYANAVIAFVAAKRDDAGPVVVDYHGVTGLIDRRGDLPTNKDGGPRERKPMSTKRGIVFHYNGPPVPEGRDDWEQVVIDAHYHVGKDWGGGQRGDGLMYHMAVARDGTAWLCRDFESTLWHCGTSKNRTALACYVNMGGLQRATAAQVATCARISEDAIRRHGWSRADITGHMEESPTSCPGTLMGDFILPFRAGVVRPGEPGDGMADGQWFDETKRFVGGGFYAYWLSHGSLAQFGYPISGEFDLADAAAPGGKRTVQVFERAVYEYWPEDSNQPIKLRLLGNEMVAAGLIAVP